MTRKTRASRWFLSFFAHIIALDSGFGHDLEIMEELISAEDVLWGVEIIVKVILIDDLLELCGELFPRHRLVCIGRGRVIGAFWLATTPEHREAEMSAEMRKKFGVAGSQGRGVTEECRRKPAKGPAKILGESRRQQLKMRSKEGERAKPRLS